VLCVKSPKGSGKTEQLVSIVEQCRREGRTVALFGHRRALLQSMSDRLGLACYFSSSVGDPKREATEATCATLLDLGVADGSAGRTNLDVARRDTADVAGFMKVKPNGRYATCLDSMPDLDPRYHQYRVVIIDEAEQVFAHLVGGTLKERRREVYHRLRHYIRCAETVILLDADLGMVTMDTLLACDLMPGTPIRFLVNDPVVDDGGEIELYENRGHLVERLREAVRAGEKCYVATNNKNKAIELQLLLQGEHPERNIVCIHRGNSAQASVQAFLRNIVSEFEASIDVLIASPSLGTGVDITFPGADGVPRTVVQHTFGLFSGNITTHTDIDQQLMRVRHPGQVHVWVDPAEQNYETDVNIIKGELERTVRHTHALMGFKDDGTPIFADDDGLIDIWARVTAAARGSKNQLATLFAKLRRDNGWRLVLVRKEQTVGAAGEAALRLGRDQRKEDRVARIVNAEKFADEGLARQLAAREEKGWALTDEQRAQLDRFRLERFYGEEISEDLVELDAESRTRQAIFNLECLLSSGERNLEVDQQEGFRTWEPDRGARLVRGQLLGILLASAGLFDLERMALVGDAPVEQRTLGPFIEKLEQHKAQFESIFALPMRQDADLRRVQQLGAVLGLIGLRFGRAKAEDKGGRKLRRYRLESKQLTRLIGIVERRRKVWLARPDAQSPRSLWEIRQAAGLLAGRIERGEKKTLRFRRGVAMREALRSKLLEWKGERRGA